MDADWLVGVEAQHAQIDRNTKQFVAGKPANNVLLTGSRGTGKSSLVKAMLSRYAKRGLRLIEVEKEHLNDMPDIVDQIADEPYRFVLFCDDLSFDQGDGSYKALKAILDGSIAAATPNVLLYATSNRRHLLPEYFTRTKRRSTSARKCISAKALRKGVALRALRALDFVLSVLAGRLPRRCGFMGRQLALRCRWTKKHEAFERDALNWALQRGSRPGAWRHQFARVTLPGAHWNRRVSATL